MKKILLIIILLMPGFMPQVNADQVSALYSATVAVTDDSIGERNKALRAGLLEVLVKLTGSADIASKPQVGSLLANASTYTIEFGYVNLPDRSQGQGLKVQYSQVEIDRFLRQNQLPVWPVQRPLLLVWVAKEPLEGEQSFAVRDEDEELYKQLDSFFSRRGLPVGYPLYDLEDLSNLNIADAWSLDAEKIAAASRRYDAVSWLLLRCYETSTGSWRVASVMNSQQKNENEQRVYLDNQDGAALDDVLARMVDTAVDRIASNYVYIPSLTVEKLIFSVKGIASFNHYNQLVDLLKSLSMVKTLGVAAIDGDQIHLQLELEGGSKQFVESLQLFDQLSVVSDIPAMAESVTVQWLPR